MNSKAGRSLIGAFAAAYALLQFRRATWWALAGCFVCAGSLGAACMLTLVWLQEREFSPQLWVFVLTLLRLFPVCFILEEVSFRGALDAHAFTSNGTVGLPSALFISLLWGLWHLPLLSEFGAAWVGLVLFAHLLIGVPLTLFWRRSGNLAVPAFAHAWIDAVRDSLLAGSSV